MHKRYPARRTSTVLAVATTLVLGLFLPGQGAADPSPPSQSKHSNSVETADNSCFASFAGGAGPAAFQACYSRHGNLVDLNAAGLEQIFAEGYKLCDLTSGAEYFDYGNSESGWGVPTINQPNGPNTLPLSISRTTTDGRWELVQAFGFLAPERRLFIASKVINRSGVPREAQLQRYVDVDADGSFGDDLTGKSLNSVWTHDENNGQGVLLTSQTPQLPRVTAVNFFPGAPDFPGTCTPPSEPTPNTIAADWTGTLTHGLGVLAHSRYKVVRVRYVLI